MIIDTGRKIVWSNGQRWPFPILSVETWNGGRSWAVNAHPTAGGSYCGCAPSEEDGIARAVSFLLSRGEDRALILNAFHREVAAVAGALFSWIEGFSR